MQLYCVCVVPLLLLLVAGQTPVNWEYKGFSYTNDKYCPNVSFATSESDLSLFNLGSTGANFISLVVTNWQDSINTTSIFATNLTATDAALAHAIGTAHKLGLSVMMKPQVDLTSDPAHWRGNIGTYFNDSQWEEWFASYTTMIVHYAELAQQNDVEIFSLGCELIATSPRDAQWRAVAASVRQVFTGLVTYSANWGGEETNKTWWDVCDFIGVDAYYRLATNISNPTVQDYVEAWNMIIKIGESNVTDGWAMRGGLLNLTQSWNKSIAFTETGTCSGGCQKGGPNMTHMNIFINGLFGAFQDVNWFKGIFWWNWVTDPAFGGEENSCMSPAFKPAEQLFRYLYGGTYNSIRPPYPATCACIL